MSEPSPVPAWEAELTSFRAHLAAARVCRQSVERTYLRGARELLAFLASCSRPATAVRPEDLAAFEAWLRRRERGGIHALLAGARAYLRLHACRGTLVVDEALFLALSPRIASGTRAAVMEASQDESEGAELYARVLRELIAFDAALLAQGRGRLRRRAYARALVKLSFFLARSGKELEAFTLDDWLSFEAEVRAGHTRRAAGLVLAGARAYLRLKSERGEAPPEALPPAFHVAALARLGPAGQRELRAFQERLLGSHTRATVRCYAWGVRELLAFLERERKAVPELTPAGFLAFCDELRAMGERGEVARSRVGAALCGVRLYLRACARLEPPHDEALLPLIAPAHLDQLHTLHAARGPEEAQAVREADDFHEQRRKLGYTPSASARHGARSLLHFLATKGRALADVTHADFADFQRQVERDTRSGRAQALVAGAAAYLRLRARQGALRASQVPHYERRRAAPKALPETLLAGLGLLDEAMQAAGFAASTRPTYRRALRGFFVWLHEVHGIAVLGEVSRDAVTAYRLHVQAEPRSNGEPYALLTQVGIFTALRFFFGWLVKTGRLLVDPTVHLPRLRRPKHLPRAVKAAELARLIARQPGTLLGRRDKALIELVYGTGMRRFEVARLRLDDLDLEARVVLIRQGKGKKDRVVPLGRKAKEALLDYLENVRPRLLRGEDRGALFVGRDGAALSADAVTHRVIALGRRAGLKLGPHVLRHSCATHLLRGRADIRHIQRLLGHESLATTERYTQVEVQDLRSVIQRCHPRERR